MASFSHEQFGYDRNRDCTEKNETGKKKRLITKNPQFYFKWLKMQAILPTHGLISLTKFHDNRARNADFFLLVLKFGISLIFFRTVSRYVDMYVA